MKNMKYFRHGDLDGRKIDKIPKSAKPLETKTLAYGEVTGHHHSFKSGQVLVYDGNGQKLDVGGEQIEVQKYIEVKEDAILSHQEHKEITVPKGNYAILQEREYSPFDQEIRRVMD